MKALAVKLGLTLITAGLLIIPQANAGYYNFGTLDVRPFARDGAANEWFIEYLKPGDQKQELLQVSNFSGETKQLNIYAADTHTNEGKSFYAADIKAPREDVSEWITLPTDTMTLQPGESRILSVNFRLPSNAGVGLHTGAIMIRENVFSETGNFKNVAIEKGIRVYMNVTGPAITEGRISGFSASAVPGSYTAHIQTTNTGTTDYKAAYGMSLRDISGATFDSAKTENRVKPSMSKTADVLLQSPSFGFYQVVVTDGQTESVMGYMLYLPLWSLLLAAGFALSFGVAKNPSPKRRKSPAINWAGLITEFSAKFSRSATGMARSLELQKSFAYLGVLGLATVSTMYVANFDPQYAKSQVIGDAPVQSYELTVKWGNFRDIWLPENYRKQWHGRIFFPNATISTLRLLDFERNDNAQIMGDNTALRYDMLTGPDNDGIVLNVDSRDGNVPMVRYEDFDREITYEFPITDFLGASGIYPNGLFATYFKTEYGEAMQLREEAIRVGALTELEATAEAEATPPPVAQIPELENLFIEDLPATPEVLTDFILTSDYVNEISEENETAHVETDAILLQALQATPDVLQEIAATPDLNFVFIPTETVNFPPQEFSFKDEKNTEQDLGTLIFVQNKKTAWNTYISTTDFQLLSGDSVIPASALNVIPGKPILLKENGKKVREGKEKKFRDKDDKTELVSVDANGDAQEIFALRPKLQVRIPAGTPAGTYLGSLTISSL